jgi:hypothetical protein
VMKQQLFIVLVSKTVSREVIEWCMQRAGLLTPPRNHYVTTLQARSPRGGGHSSLRALPSDHARRFTIISEVDPHKPMDDGGLRQHIAHGQ